MTDGYIPGAIQQIFYASVCSISMETGVKHSQVWRVLHIDGFYLYHIQKVLLP